MSCNGRAAIYILATSAHARRNQKWCKQATGNRPADGVTKLLRRRAGNDGETARSLINTQFDNYQHKLLYLVCLHFPSII